MENITATQLFVVSACICCMNFETKLCEECYILSKYKHKEKSND